MNWISVKKELPKTQERVLVYIVNQYSTSNIATGFVMGIKNKWRIVFDDSESAGHFSSDYVSHWMPLPEPPKP